MGGRQIERIRVPDEITQRALDPLRDAVNGLQKSVELQGDGARRQIKFQLVNAGDDISLANATVVKLTHKLGYALKGWIVVDLRDSTASGRI